MTVYLRIFILAKDNMTCWRMERKRTICFEVRLPTPVSSKDAKGEPQQWRAHFEAAPPHPHMHCGGLGSRTAILKTPIVSWWQYLDTCL